MRSASELTGSVREGDGTLKARMMSGRAAAAESTVTSKPERRAMNM
jgi:hypothetical protein